MRRSGSGGERGQATAEWIGLVLVLTLLLGGALSAARGADFGGEAKELSATLTSTLACATRDTCRAEAAAMRRLPELHARGHSSTTRRARLLRRWTSAPSEAFGRRGIRPSAPWERAPRGLRGLEAASPRVLRALGRAGEYGWIVCLGYHQIRYDLEHPRAPTESMPIDAVLDELNTCLNPLSWVIP